MFKLIKKLFGYADKPKQTIKKELYPFVKSVTSYEQINRQAHILQYRPYGY